MCTISNKLISYSWYPTIQHFLLTPPPIHGITSLYFFTYIIFCLRRTWIMVWSNLLSSNRGQSVAQAPILNNFVTIIQAPPVWFPRWLTDLEMQELKLTALFKWVILSDTSVIKHHLNTGHVEFDVRSVSEIDTETDSFSICHSPHRPVILWLTGQGLYPFF